jgi:hypothetical protein
MRDRVFAGEAAACTGNRFGTQGGPVPTSAEGANWAVRDAQLLSLIDTPDEVRKFVRYGNEVEFLTSTILVQAVHHASEHRAQISDILAANKMDVLNLDEIDLWSFEKWEKSR